MLKHKISKPQPPTRLVVLGAGGFIGGALVNKARVQKIPVMALGSHDIDLTAAGANEKLANVLNPGDSLIFASAIDKGLASDGDILLKNLAMARNVIGAAREISLAQLIYLSSDAVYSTDESLIKEETPAAAATLYGAMHRTRELMLEASNVPLAVLRLTAIYGSGDTHNAYGPNRFLREAFDKKTITLFGEGEEVRDHLHIDDAAQMILLVASHQSTGLLNLASGTAASFYNLATLIAQKTGAQIKKEPRRIAITHKHHDVTERLVAFPSYIPKSLESGIKEYLMPIEQSKIA